MFVCFSVAMVIPAFPFGLLTMNILEILYLILLTCLSYYDMKLESILFFLFQLFMKNINSVIQQCSKEVFTGEVRILMQMEMRPSETSPLRRQDMLTLGFSSLAIIGVNLPFNSSQSNSLPFIICLRRVTLIFLWVSP